MKHLRLIAMVLLAVFALGAVAASAAQAEEAPFWTVGGSRLKKGETRFVTGKAVGSFVFTGGGVTIDCKERTALPSPAIKGSEPGEPGTGEGAGVFKDCLVEGNGTGPECDKVTEPIETRTLKTTLVEDKTKTKLLVLLQPASGNEFSELKFPKGCKFESTKVTGSILGEVLTDPGEKAIELPNEKIEAVSWLTKVPAIQPRVIWEIKEGVGKEVETKQLEAFGVALTLSGTGLGSLANSKGESIEEKWSPLP
jgi:hypothetical protein